MKDLLKCVDKALFNQLLRSGSESNVTGPSSASQKITYDQFKTRMFERIQKKDYDDKYFCLDDLKAILPRKLTEHEYKIMEQVVKTIHRKGSLGEITLQDSLRELKPWESSKKCLRSMFNIGAGTARLKKRRKHNPNLVFGSS